MISAEEFDKLALARLRTLAPGTDRLTFRIFLNLSRVNARLLADFEVMVQRPHGLTWPGFRLLFCLWVAGPLQTRELARLLATTAPTVSSVLNTLERKGYLARERLEHDQRLVEARLTDAGRAVIEAAFRDQHAREEAWLDEVTRKDMKALVEILERLSRRHRPTAP
jgi:DNA-binding MarR family transcriptional regulator